MKRFTNYGEEYERYVMRSQILSDHERYVGPSPTVASCLAGLKAPAIGLRRTCATIRRGYRLEANGETEYPGEKRIRYGKRIPEEFTPQFYSNGKYWIGVMPDGRAMALGWDIFIKRDDAYRSYFCKLRHWGYVASVEIEKEILAVRTARGKSETLGDLLIAMISDQRDAARLSRAPDQDLWDRGEPRYASEKIGRMMGASDRLTIGDACGF